MSVVIDPKQLSHRSDSRTHPAIPDRDLLSMQIESGRDLPKQAPNADSSYNYRNHEPRAHCRPLHAIINSS